MQENTKIFHYLIKEPLSFPLDRLYRKRQTSLLKFLILGCGVNRFSPSYCYDRNVTAYDLPNCMGTWRAFQDKGAWIFQDLGFKWEEQPLLYSCLVFLLLLLEISRYFVASWSSWVCAFVVRNSWWAPTQGWCFLSFFFPHVLHCMTQLLMFIFRHITFLFSQLLLRRRTNACLKS